MVQTVGDYQYYYNYLIELEKYYNSTVKIHGYGKLTKLCKEIKTLKELLKLNK